MAAGCPGYGKACAFQRAYYVPLIHAATVILTSRIGGGDPAGMGSPRAAQVPPVPWFGPRLVLHPERDHRPRRAAKLAGAPRQKGDTMGKSQTRRLNGRATQRKITFTRRLWEGDMRRLVLLVMNTLLFVGLAAAPKPATAAPLVAPAVVTLTCFGNPLQTQTNYTVLLVDASANSPAISTGGSCAAALALLVSQGFKDIKVTPSGDSLLLLFVYTLVRSNEVNMN
jgi:hypothetical protein